MGSLRGLRAMILAIAVAVAVAACANGDDAAQSVVQDAPTSDTSEAFDVAPIPTHTPSTPQPPAQSVGPSAGGVDFSWLGLPPGAPYDGYTSVVDDTGSITVDVPTAWSDVDPAPIDAGDHQDPSIWASPDLESFTTAWDVPGATVNARLAMAAEEVWTEIGAGADEACREGQEYDYDDGAYTGEAVLWSGCGPSEAAVLQIVAGPETTDWLFDVQVQMVTTADIDVAVEVIGSFAFTGDGEDVASVEDGVQPPTGGREAAGIDFGWLDLPAGEPYEAYSAVTDDSGALQVSVPTSWTDVDGAPDEIEGQQVPSVWAAPSLTDYLETWAGPGLQLDLRGVDLLRDGEVLALAEEVGVFDACEDTQRYEYYDGAYTGTADLYQSCGDVGSAYLIIGAAVPNADETISQFFALRMQLATTADVDAAIEAIRTFHTLEGEAPVVVEDGEADLSPDAQSATDFLVEVIAQECGYAANWTDTTEDREGSYDIDVGVTVEGGTEVVMDYLVYVYTGDQWSNTHILSISATATEYCPLEDWVLGQ